MMKPPAASIDDYLSKLPAEQRAALETLRGQIRALAPGAEEAISYGLPTFRLNGNLVHFGAAAKHCAFYPGAVITQFADRLKGFETAKGTIRFQPDAPLPPELVEDIVRHRVAQNAAIAAERKARKTR
ncbi:MAG: iron chaperone [Caulobacter sp.]|nr:iron chaperone [Caulobacter sp.]